MEAGEVAEGAITLVDHDRVQEPDGPVLVKVAEQHPAPGVPVGLLDDQVEIVATRSSLAVGSSRLARRSVARRAPGEGSPVAWARKSASSAAASAWRGDSGMAQ